MPRAVEYGDFLFSGLQSTERVLHGIFLDSGLVDEEISRLPSPSPSLEHLQSLGDDVLLLGADEEVATRQPRTKGISDQERIELL